MLVLAVASAGCDGPRPVSWGPGRDAQVWPGMQEGMLRFDLVCPEPHLPEAGLWDGKSLFFQELSPKEGHGMAWQLPAGWAPSTGTGCGVLPPRPSTASSAPAPKWTRWQHLSERLSWQPPAAQPQAAAAASAAELISACNQQGMKRR